MLPATWPPATIVRAKIVESPRNLAQCAKNSSRSLAGNAAIRVAAGSAWCSKKTKVLVFDVPDVDLGTHRIWRVHHFIHSRPGCERVVVSLRRHRSGGAARCVEHASDLVIVKGWFDHANEGVGLVDPIRR